MPIYEHQCPKGHTFERIVSISEFVEKAPCPKCGADAPLKPSHTAKPKFVRGVGGFYNPSN